MTVDIRTGNSLEILRSLADESVNCVVTSPPYYRLRDYGTGRWEGGDTACDHLRTKGYSYTLQGSNNNALEIFPDVCRKCGATRVDDQIGLEQTPEEFIAKLVAVFDEIWRVLRPDGTVWINIGDTYAATGGTRQQGGSSARAGRANIKAQEVRESTRPPKGYKPKDLLGIPWMLAFALRARGWYLRQDIIWNKPNPMPETVPDRCTKAHEYLFLIAKSGRTTCWRHETGAWMTTRPPADYVWRNAETGKESANPVKEKGWRRVNRWRGFDYYFDQSAILEPASVNTHARLAQNGIGDQKGSPHPQDGRPMKAVGRKVAQPGQGVKNNTSFDAAMKVMPTERNKRSVWTVTTEKYPEAHFATFPTRLIEPCIKAGCPRGGVVLDPFGGAGTTGLVADRLQRSAILIELNPEYAEMARSRIFGERAGFPMLDAMGA